MGLKAKLNPFAIESEKKTHQLLEVVQTDPILSKGMLRIAHTEQLREDFYQCSLQNDDVEWVQQCKTFDPYFPDAPGIFIHSALTIDSKSYLEGLRTACEEKGLAHVNKHINDLNELERFDFIVLATGAHSFDFHHLKVFPIKGQLLELEWPADYPPLPFAINSQVYITMTRDKKRCIVGATHEHHFSTDDPDQLAESELLPKAFVLYPPLKNAKILSVKAALWCTTANRIPFAGHIQDNVYGIMGMGSRGLLYHAYYAEKLAELILQR